MVIISNGPASIKDIKIKKHLQDFVLTLISGGLRNEDLAPFTSILDSRSLHVPTDSLCN